MHLIYHGKNNTKTNTDHYQNASFRHKPPALIRIVSITTTISRVTADNIIRLYSGLPSLPAFHLIFRLQHTNTRSESDLSPFLCLLRSRKQAKTIWRSYRKNEHSFFIVTLQANPSSTVGSDFRLTPDCNTQIVRKQMWGLFAS